MCPHPLFHSFLFASETPSSLSLFTTGFKQSPQFCSHLFANDLKMCPLLTPMQTRYSRYGLTTINQLTWVEDWLPGCSNNRLRQAYQTTDLNSEEELRRKEIQQGVCSSQLCSNPVVGKCGACKPVRGGGALRFGHCTHVASLTMLRLAALLSLPLRHLPYILSKFEKEFMFVQSKGYFQLFKILPT